MTASRPPAPTAVSAAILLAIACQACSAQLQARAEPAPVATPLGSASEVGPGAYGDYSVDEAPAPAGMVPNISPGDIPAPAPGPALGPDAMAMEPEGPDDSAPPPVPSDEDAEEGDLRLVRRADLGSGFIGGALQAFVGGFFGAVCDNQFTPADADVACRQLGFVGGTSEVGGFFPADLESDADVIAPFVLENLNCTGAEERLVDCPGATALPYSEYGAYLYQTLGSTTGTCDFEGTYARVACGTITDQEDGDIRLAPAEDGVSDDGNTQYGRLETFSGGGWLPVCDSTAVPAQTCDGERLPDEAVAVACRQLGFARGEKALAGKTVDAPEPNQADPFEISTLRPVPLLPAGAACSGSEATLAACPRPAAEVEDARCDSVFPDILSLVCSNTGPESDADGDVRLAEGQAGPGFEYGRLEIFLRGVWRAICDDDGFTPDAANVACAALGFDGGAALLFRQAADGVLRSTRPVGLTKVDCDGSEASLLQCSSVSTYDAITDRRNTGESFASCVGRGTFGGLPTTDSTLLACGDSSGSCPETAPAQGSVRLRGGFGTPCDPLHTGFIEVFNAGEWGAICIPRFGLEDTATADVVCRQLGFPHGTAVNPRTPFVLDSATPGGQEEGDEPQGRFWFPEEQVRCLGPEDRLVDCDLGVGFREDNSGCRNSPTRLTVACRSFAVPEALEAVTTPGAEEGDLRLMDQSSVANWRLGRLELFFEGSWGQVCSTTAAFSAQDAAVACRQLGFAGGAVAPNEPLTTFRSSSSRFDRRSAIRDESGRLVFPEVALAGGPGCSGGEERLLDCVDGGPLAAASSSGTCFETQDYDPDTTGLFIACVAEAEPGVEGSLRLTTTSPEDRDNDPSAGVGVLEVFHAGAWGTLCNGDPGPVPENTDYEYQYTAPMPDVTLTQEAAEVACRQLGFTGGEFRGIERIPEEVPPLRPSWLRDLPCTTGAESTVADCGALAFGDTASCGPPQRLLCDDGVEDVALLTPRLVDGEADPGGAWAYGRLELFDGAAFVPVSDARGRQELGRRGAQVACRTLGFATGGQALAGFRSALPIDEGTFRDGAVGAIGCRGDEATLADCPLEPYMYEYDNYERTVEDNAVALVCYNPSGCPASDAPPAQGDVRLVSLNGIDTATQPCDDVHLGGVEFFNDGEWGRICVTGFRSRSTWTVDAIVACRQLGFPFGSVMDNTALFRDRGAADYEPPDGPTLASIVLCTGAEERLEDCFFAEEFGDLPVEYSERPDLSRPCPDNNILSVICRRFPMEESQVIRRL